MYSRVTADVHVIITQSPKFTAAKSPRAKARTSKEVCFQVEAHKVKFFLNAHLFNTFLTHFFEFLRAGQNKKKQEQQEQHLPCIDLPSLAGKKVRDS